MKSPEAADFLLGIAGAGAMGQGIAEVAAAGGVTLRLFDADPAAAATAIQNVKGRFARLVEKGRMTAAEAEAAGARLTAVETLTGFAPCDAVIEAVFEDLEIKRRLFADLESVVASDCLIASNTSSIPIAAIARACARRGRIAGLHFFNPVPLMQLVEVISGPETAEATIETLAALGRRLGRVPLRVRDAPGFLVNLGGRAFTTEALRIVHDGIATPSQVDAVMRDCRHFRMGPFELMDLTGIDVNYPVSRIVYEGYMADPRLGSAPNHKALFDAGRFGRKSGAGWYRYDAEGRLLARPSPDHETAAAPAARVALAAPDQRLAAFCAEVGLKVAGDDGACPILAAPLGSDATTTALESGADFRRLVCLDLLCDTSQRVTLMTAPGADPAVRDAVAAALTRSGRRVTAIKDSPGFIAQRIAAMVANLGCYMAEIGLAAPPDIDTAMRLGLNYPLGPLELAADLGLTETCRILERLQALTGEDRYRPTLWISRRAALGLPIHTAS